MGSGGVDNLTRRSGRGQKVHLELRKDHQRIREELGGPPESREGPPVGAGGFGRPASEDPRGGPGRFERPTWSSIRGQKAHPEVLLGLGSQSGGLGGVGRPFWRSGRC